MASNGKHRCATKCTVKWWLTILQNRLINIYSKGMKKSVHWFCYSWWHMKLSAMWMAVTHITHNHKRYRERKKTTNDNDERLLSTKKRQLKSKKSDNHDRLPCFMVNAHLPIPLYHVYIFVAVWLLTVPTHRPPINMPTYRLLWFAPFHVFWSFFSRVCT